MGYLLIKKDDAKTFKSFLSGNEIEVGVRISAKANIFHPDDEVYVFYDNDDSDTYQARITRQKRAPENANDSSLVMLGLVRR
jgi:translation elongation factor P/translation initiation factor 5A